ncbi:hypothetical protein QS460_05710 [Liquorilactobacillus mali]|uniref:Uncharacterized protein n=1 Tax=Liquorilactobacillus mali TaxID=1618 RepID=A0A0R2FUZ1_9LACO|nr:hypothetical protein [Liquorilactobacillus mali]KRN32080.1 hypothetical protein IV36_GL001331 [Liquorilactobacillus mali]MDN7145420.1 hypothetical protein [Liquorilactobacillus mali]
MSKKAIIIFSLGVFFIFLSFEIFSYNVSSTKNILPKTNSFVQSISYITDLKDKHIQGKYVYKVDNATISRNSRKNPTLDINGWIIKKGTHINSVSIKVALKNKSNSYSLLPTVVTTRPDVTSTIDDGTNYNYSGFSVHMLARKKIINRRTRLYIFLQINGSTKIIKTNTYLE